VEVDERKINAKSLLGVLSMGITTGTTISLIADGSDEEAAVKALAALLEKDVY
jgi:phosphocarrier protein